MIQSISSPGQKRFGSGNKKAGNISGKILFLGDVKGTDKLIPVIDVKFDDSGVKYGWAGNQAVLYVEPKALTNREGYDAFLEKLSDLPVPDFLKTLKDNIAITGTDEDISEEIEEETTGEKSEQVENEKKHKPFAILSATKKALKNGADAIGKMGSHVAAKSEELFRDKNLMKRQMLFYGVVHLYNDGLEKVYESVRRPQMQKNSAVQQGWAFATEILGADVAANMGASYVDAIEQAIKQLEDNINNHQYRNLGIGQLQGYMLEEWGSGTFNVDAVAADSADRAAVLHSTAKDSVDIQLDSGKHIAQNRMSQPKKTAKAQARFTPETGNASYKGQGRLVPSDQLTDARAAAHREALRNQPIRSEVSEAYAETETELTDTIKNEEGISSRSASRKELEEIAKESKDKSFNAEEHGVSVESAIKTEHLLKQALKAGYTAAAVTVAVQLAPEIYKAIDFLIKHGELDVQQIKRWAQKGYPLEQKVFCAVPFRLLSK